MKCRIIGIILLATALLSGCGRLPDQTFYALDTIIELRQLEGVDASAARQAQQKVSELETMLSCHKEGGDIWQLNNGTYHEPVAVSQQTYDLLLRAQEISLKTQGRFDVTVKPLAELWDVKNAQKPPGEADILRVMDQVGFPNLELEEEDKTVRRLSPDTQVDLGGMAKGFIADELKSFLKAQGAQRGILDLGGSITLIGEKKGGKPWNVGIKNPFDQNASYASLSLRDTSVVTSGGYERYFTYEGRRYHHIFDPYTGQPAQSGLQSVTVVTQDTALADALSTAVYVGGLELGRQWAEYYGVELIMVDDQKKVWITEGLRDKITIVDPSFQIMEVEENV